MTAIVASTLFAWQESAAAYQNASPVLSVILMSVMIGVIMVCLLIIGVLSFSERIGRGPRTRA